MDTLYSEELYYILATTAEQWMATGDIKQVTNNSGSNYCKMPDGTLIQWGVIGGYQSAKRRDLTVNFPISFLNTDAYQVFVTSMFSSESTPYECLGIVKHVSASQCIIHQVNATDNYSNTIAWLAIGRWK